MIFKGLLLFLAFNNRSSQEIYTLKEEFKGLLSHRHRVGCFRRLGKGLRHDSNVEVGI